MRRVVTSSGRQISDFGGVSLILPPPPDAEPEAEPVQGEVTFDPLETAAALARLAARLRNE